MNTGALPDTQLNSQRPWSVPERPWIMVQSWNDLLFAHWPVDAELVRRQVPRVLDLDTYDGQAWVGIVPFRISGISLRRIPVEVPGISAFPELNVRTYVTAPGGSKPGVYFFSLDAANPCAVAAARLWFHLPYFAAQMVCSADPISSDTIMYRSKRWHPGAPAATFIGRYGPSGPVFLSQPGTLDAWLTERYCLYTTDHRGQAYRCDIDHQQWPLQSATAELQWDGLISQHRLELPDRPPLLHFARRLDVRTWTVEPIPSRSL